MVVVAENECFGPSDNPWEAWGVSVPKSELSSARLPIPTIKSPLCGLLSRLRLIWPDPSRPHP